MKLTKFQHACVVLEKAQTTIVIDLGNLSHDFITPNHVDAFVFTHSHPDHLDTAHVRHLLKMNPHAVIIGDSSITTEFSDVTTIPVTAGLSAAVKDVTLRFFGGEHASIAEGVTTPPNLGVLVDNRLYYSGDSFALPDVPVEILALPVSAPWLKLGETLAFLRSVHPAVVFPTHDGILSADGKIIVDRLVQTSAQPLGIRYVRLDNTSLEI